MWLGTWQQAFQRPFNFAIVDEADSVLIDESRNPMILSGGNPTPDSEERFKFELAQKVRAPFFFGHVDSGSTACLIKALADWLV